jgi:hypothetical protein
VVDRTLRLTARDADDLGVVSACVQDAIARLRDMTFVERERRFVLMVDRFMWESSDGAAKNLHQRVRTAIQFDDVRSVRTMNLDPEVRDNVLDLLAISIVDGAEGAATVDLAFAGGGTIRLEVDCIECRLTDIGAPWTTRRRPRHDPDGT